jgi:hypothetical protein
VIPLHPHKDLIKIIKMAKMNMKMKMSTMIKFKRRALIKEEMRIKIKATQDLHHHIQGCATLCKEITPRTTFLDISRKG